MSDAGLQKYAIWGGTVPPQISLVKLEVGSRICKIWKVKAKSWKLEATFEKNWKL